MGRIHQNHPSVTEYPWDVDINWHGTDGNWIVSERREGQEDVTHRADLIQFVVADQHLYKVGGSNTDRTIQYGSDFNRRSVKDQFLQVWRKDRQGNDYQKTVLYTNQTYSAIKAALSPTPARYYQVWIVWLVGIVTPEGEAVKFEKPAKLQLKGIPMYHTGLKLKQAGKRVEDLDGIMMSYSGSFQAKTDSGREFPVPALGSFKDPSKDQLEQATKLYNLVQEWVVAQGVSDEPAMPSDAPMPTQEHPTQVNPPSAPMPTNEPSLPGNDPDDLPF
jgi:hypothetical protein